MRAIILSIGDELTAGLTVNSNAAWLAQQLLALGIRSSPHVTVGDDFLAIVEAVRQAVAGGADLLLITGGLGPTEDDLTRQALADALQETLVEDPDAVLWIENWFSARGRVMSPSNRVQALRPHSASCVENAIGTAPGLRARKDATEIYVMPGVPREMAAMFTRSFLPAIRAAQEKNTGTNGATTLVTRINTFGLGESVLGERIRDLMTRGGNPSVGTTVQDGIVAVRIYATGTPPEAAAMTDRARALIEERLGSDAGGLIFGENDETLEAALARLLIDARHSLATAESCTGGLLAMLLTSTPGSSDYFRRGWVTYTNAAKHDELNVSNELLQTHGAVSEAVVRAMAENARKFGHADFALATTGIAGPDGGSDANPVGTVWIALASPEGTDAHRFIFPGDRAGIRLRASQMALALLRWKLLGITPAI